MRREASHTQTIEQTLALRRGTLSYSFYSRKHTPEKFQVYDQL